MSISSKSPESVLASLIAGITDEAKSKAWSGIDVGLERSGKKIILPAEPLPMSNQDAIITIQRIDAEEKQTFDVSELVAGLPWDSAVAVYKALQQVYGVITSTTIQTMFGPRDPTYLTVRTGPGATDVVQVPIGAIQLPGSKATFTIGVHKQGAYIGGKVNKADRARLIEVGNLARKILRDHSIYRGKAISVKIDPEGGMSVSSQPEFIDVSKVSKTDSIHNEITEDLIDTNIFSVLENTAKCRENRIPLKRGILLEGPYGTGKSLTAQITAKVATDNGWGFIMLSESQGLKAALDYARTVQPVVIFAEDIDRNADRKDNEVNNLINTLDGVDTKTNEIVVILTTNYIEKIDKALLRPGRFDAVISLERPDAKTVGKLIRKYAADRLDAAENIDEVTEILKGRVPASIREVVERAKLAMLQKGASTITARDLRTQAVGMTNHLDMLDNKKIEPTLSEKFTESLSELVRLQVSKQLEPIAVSMTKIENALL